MLEQLDGPIDFCYVFCRGTGISAAPHGFRSSFRDWVSEETDFDGAIAEMALAHSINNKVGAAYRRGNLLVKRHKLIRQQDPLNACKRRDWLIQWQCRGGAADGCSIFAK